MNDKDKRIKILENALKECLDYFDGCQVAGIDDPNECAAYCKSRIEHLLFQDLENFVASCKPLTQEDYNILITCLENIIAQIKKAEHLKVASFSYEQEICTNTDSKNAAVDWEHTGRKKLVLDFWLPEKLD